MTSPVADVDQVAIALAALKSNANVLAAFGGVAAISGLNEPPYPHLTVLPGNAGDDGDLMWSTEVEVQLEAWGALDGTPGRAELRRLLYIACTELAALPRQPYIGGPVVVGVRMVGTGRWQPDPASGQPRWLHIAAITATPSNA